MAVCSLSVIVLISVFLLLLVRKLFWASNSTSLRNKHVLVTGGSSGIGKSTAMEAAKRGANVTVLARDKTKLEATVEEMKKAAIRPGEQKMQYFVLDVTESLKAVDEAVKSAEDTAGPVFLLVNCVGAAIYGEFETATESDFRSMLNVNYFGTIFPTLSIGKRMKERKKGHIVITGSQAGLLGIYGASAYAASKFALRGFAESLHMELKPHGVSVTVFCPPETDTPGYKTEQTTKPELTKLLSRCGGELFKPEEIGRRLLSDALGGKFWSYVGLEGLVMTTLSAGMGPLSSFTDVALQVSLMSPLRLVFVGYRIHFARMIQAYVQASKKKEETKKAE